MKNRRFLSPECPPPAAARRVRVALWLAVPLLLTACATTGPARPALSSVQTAAPPPDRDATMALVLADTIQSVQRLVQAGSSEQAELLAGARIAAERAPLGTAQLRYALMLAVPGPAARDADRAQSLMRQLAAQQEGLTPVERALLLVQLAQLDRELGLRSDNQRLQSEAQRNEQQKQNVANQRLQTEIAENAKLRKQLEDAQAKLDAIAQIERSLNERQGATEGRKP
jgi:hypothetical protein